MLYGSWLRAFVGGGYEFLHGGARLLDARTQFHYIATVMAHAQVGAGSAYAYTVHDARGNILDGGKAYRLHVDPDPPGQELLVGRCLRHPDPLADPGPLHHLSRSGQQLGHAASRPRRLLRPVLRPALPRRQKTNWVETIPGKFWFPIFRLYGPLWPWFDQTWKLNEFEPLD